jgi:hypothetical protein
MRRRRHDVSTDRVSGTQVEFDAMRSRTWRPWPFVRGDFSAQDYWSFVHYRRRGATDHRRGVPGKIYYDVVYGPVAAFWNQRMIIADADQISFHTGDAETLLNSGSTTTTRSIL